MLTLNGIRESLDGAVPGTIATCDNQGIPNVSFISQVDYVDSEHVALSYQFFNKTRQNILQNATASVAIVHPMTGAVYILNADYLRTETEGPLFQRMKVKLAGIASHEGMGAVFQLRGADIYRVESIEEVPGRRAPLRAPTRNLLAASRAAVERIAACTSLDQLLDSTLASLHELFGVQHGMILMLDAVNQRLYTVASRGYDSSGVGAEVALGDGVIGVAAEARTPIRIGHFAPEYAYRRAIREATAKSELAPQLAIEIPFAGLAEPHSQLAVPIMALQQLIGVLYLESAEDLHFSYDDEDALVAVTGQLAFAIRALQASADASEDIATRNKPQSTTAGAPVYIRHYAENDSVFLNEEYLIKGVAGAIFWTLVRDFVHLNRCEFTNRELRLDQRIRLPDVTDNLEARLILLERRLAEHGAGIRIVKTGRGRFRLQSDRPLQLLDIPQAKR